MKKLFLRIKRILVYSEYRAAAYRLHNRWERANPNYHPRECLNVYDSLMISAISATNDLFPDLNPIVPSQDLLRRPEAVAHWRGILATYDPAGWKAKVSGIRVVKETPLLPVDTRPPNG